MNETNTNDWEAEFKALMDDKRTGLRESSDTNKTRYALLAIVDDQIALAEKRGAERATGVLETGGYINHTRLCILSYSEAGRPTATGGYESKYRGIWYETRPVDNTPKCDWGLAEVLNFLTNTK